MVAGHSGFSSIAAVKTYPMFHAQLPVPRRPQRSASANLSSFSTFPPIFILPKWPQWSYESICTRKGIDSPMLYTSINSANVSC